MSQSAAYRSRMIEKHLANWGDVAHIHLRDESPDRTDWTVDVEFDDGQKLLITIVLLGDYDARTEGQQEAK